jgi:hypothetical protein
LGEYLVVLPIDLSEVVADDIDRSVPIDVKCLENQQVIHARSIDLKIVDIEIIAGISEPHVGHGLGSTSGIEKPHLVSVIYIAL